MTPNAWLVLFCVYVAVMHSVTRVLMNETPARIRTPGLPMPVSFILASLWPLFALFFVVADIVMGLRELVGKKTRE